MENIIRNTATPNSIIVLVNFSLSSFWKYAMVSSSSANKRRVVGSNARDLNAPLREIINSTPTNIQIFLSKVFSFFFIHFGHLSISL